MYTEIFSIIIINLFFLFSVALIFSTFSTLESIPKYVKIIFLGILIAVTGIGSMIYSYQGASGIFFDSRTAIVLISGMFYGTIPTLIGTVSLIAFRIYSGGAGIMPGVIGLILSSSIGLFWHYKRLRKVDSRQFKIPFLELFIIIILTQLVAVGVGYFFPNYVLPEILNGVFFPFVSINTIGGFVISIYLVNQLSKYFKTQSLIDNQHFSKTLLNISNSSVFVYNPRTKLFVDVNNQAINSYEYTKEEFLAMGLYDIDSLPKDEIDHLIASALNNELAPFTTKHMTKTGMVITVEINATTVIFNRESHVFISSTDITDVVAQKKLLNQSRMQLKTIIKNTNDGVIISNDSGEIENINDAGRSLLNINKVITKQMLEKLIHIKHPKFNSIDDIMKEVHRTKQPIHCKTASIERKKMGDTLTIDISVYPLTKTDNQFVGSVSIFRDVTIEIEHYNHIQFISQHDPVTELYNRHFLETELIRLNTKRQLPISYIMGDVNGLKLVNDAFGHQEGDLLLKEISQILKKSTRSEDIVGRWGGDEFLIILPQTSTEFALKIAERIHDLCGKSYYQTILPSVALGVGTKNLETDVVQEVLLTAEKNMYDNKMDLGPEMRENTYKKLLLKLEEVNPNFKMRIDRHIDLAKQFSKFLELGSDDTETLLNLTRNHEIGLVSLLHEGNISVESKKLHVENGYRILNAMPNYADISKYVLHHHENWDGSGYPDHLKGEEIPVPSRLIRIIDCYDDLMHNSKSKTGQNMEKTLDIMQTKLHLELDPILGQKFIDMMHNRL